MIAIMNLLPLMMSLGTITLLLVNFTDVFDYIAWLFYPLTKLTMIPDEMAVAQAAAITVAEPVTSMVVASSAASIVSRFVVGVLAIGEIVFFTGTIPLHPAKQYRCLARENFLLFGLNVWFASLHWRPSWDIFSYRQHSIATRPWFMVYLDNI